MILLKHLFLSFKNQAIFNDLTISLNTSWKIGLYGLNGAGKSTLLKAIAGLQELDKGSITIQKDIKIAYMPQEVVLQSEKTVLDETMQAFEELITIQTKLKTIEQQMKAQPENSSLVDDYAYACTLLVNQNPEKKRAECERVLRGLGFTQVQLAGSVNSLSVGWKMRIVLAQLLLKKADFYLFDEPTNHLDIVAKQWFLRFLRQNNAGFLLVCHEKQFLNDLCDRILALENGNGALYTGNYDVFMQQREDRKEQLLAAFEQQQREIADLQKTISRFKAGTRSTQAKSMEKRLEKIERIVLPTTSKKVSVTFGTPDPSGKHVLKVCDVGHSFGDKIIFQHCSFAIERGNKIAIVAPNGAGKTTLINCIMKKIIPTYGHLEWGNNVVAALFDQDQLQSLDLQKSVLENALNVGHKADTKHIRSILGSFLFDSDAINKKASVLSGGERNRLGMIRVLLQNANFLILDEPTNHLDIPSKEILLNALLHYQGTVLFVSHDQDFVNHLATHILELTAQKSALFNGSYDDYIYQKEHADSLKQSPNIEQLAPKKTTPSLPNKAVVNDSKTVVDLEKKIAKTESEIKKIEKMFETIPYGTAEFSTASNTLTKLHNELNNHMREWELLVATHS